jgi:hypothetical protein
LIKSKDPDHQPISVCGDNAPDQLSLRCNDLRAKITQLTDGEYAIAKNDVDRLRQELGQPPLPSLQNTLDGKASQ